MNANFASILAAIQQGRDPRGTWGASGGGGAGSQGEGYDPNSQAPQIVENGQLLGINQGGRFMANGRPMANVGSVFLRADGQPANEDDLLARFKDPSKINYSDTYGYYTDEDNYIPKVESSWGDYVGPILGAAGLYGIGITGGFDGLFGGQVGGVSGGEGGLFGGDPYAPFMDSTGYMGPGSGGFYPPDPYEIDMAAGSVSNNSPGIFEQGTNRLREMGGLGRTAADALSNPLQAAGRAGSWVMNNPMQAIQLAGGLFGGGGQQNQGGNNGGGDQPWNPMQSTYDPGPAPRQPIYQPIVNGQQLNQDEYLRRIGYGRG